MQYNVMVIPAIHDPRGRERNRRDGPRRSPGHTIHPLAGRCVPHIPARGCRRPCLRTCADRDLPRHGTVLLC